MEGDTSEDNQLELMETGDTISGDKDTALTEAGRSTSTEGEGQPEVKTKKRKIRQENPTKKPKTDSLELPNKGDGESLPSTTHHQQLCQEISEQDFREILSSMSEWYDRHGYIDMLKVLYRDLVTEPDKLYGATKVIELFELLCTSGHLSSTNLIVIYDTISVTKPFGLEREIRKLTEKIPFDIRTVIISTFTPNRQHMIKFVESLTDNDVKRISKLHSCEEKTNKWGLFVDLEHRGKICEENMDDFMKKVTTHLIIDSNKDPLGLRGTGKGDKDSLQETTSRTSTANIKGELMWSGDTGTRNMEASLSTLTDQLAVASAIEKAMQRSTGNVCMVNNMVQGNNGTAIGCKFENSNVTDFVIVNNTIQLPATQDNAPSQASEDNVINQYLRRTQQQLCHNAARFTPATLNTRYEVDIAHMFTDLDLLKQSKKKQDVKPTALKEVLNIIKSTPACKVLIEGEGGIGKSTLLRYIAYNWATDESDETFKGKIVFLVNISSIDKGETILDAIVKQIDLEDFHLETYLPQDTMLIKRFIWNHNNDIVLLLDGLDELKDGSESPISYFKKKKMTSSTVILTSRSGKIDEYIKASDIHVKVKGFNRDNINKYIKKHFEFFEDCALGNSLIKELEPDKPWYLCKHPEVNSMCKNPMLLLLVCTMWEERQQLPDNKSDLFKEIFRCILNQYIEKQETNKEKISKYEDIPERLIYAMVFLGKIMYEKLKINQLTINKRDLRGKEEICALALKLGFVYKDTPNLKSDFEEIFTAPHKLIVESLVGFYLYKLCQAAGSQSQCSEDMKMLLYPLDDREWNIIIESEHLYISKEFAIGFLGADACMFLNHWITNSLSTYRSLMGYFKFVKVEHRMTVEKELINHMTEKNIKIMPHINDICKSLRKCIHQVIPYVEINPNESFIHIVQRFYNIRLVFVGGIDVITRIELFCKEISSEEKGKTIAHILIAVSDQREILKLVSRLFGPVDVKYLTAECQKLNFKYDITNLHLCNLSTASFMVHLLSNAPKLAYLQCSNCVTGAIMNDVMRKCCMQVVKLDELKKLNISGNNLSNIDGSSLSSLLLIAPTLTNLNMSNCSLSGVIMNDVIRECCRQGVKLELKELDISDNNLSSTDGSSFATLFMAPAMIKLDMCNCSLSGVIINDMIRECCSQEVKLELEVLDVRNNNLNNIDGSLFASLFGVTSKLEFLSMSNRSSSSYVVYRPTLHGLCISGNNPININGSSLAALLITVIRNRLAMINCNLSGAIMNDMIRECFSRRVRLDLKELDMNGNNLRSIDGALLAFLLAIAPEMSSLNMSNCSVSSDIMNDMIRECCSRRVSLELIELSISGNNLSNVDGSSFASIFIVPTLCNLDMSNCSLSGDIMNDVIRECCSKGINLELTKLNISGNNLSNIAGSSFASIFFAPTLNNLDMSNCCLSGDIMNDMIRGFCSRGFYSELVELDINGNNLSNIDGSLLASLLVIAHTLCILNISNCSLSGAIINDTITECCSQEHRLELTELDIGLKFLQLNISGNNLRSIDGSLLASLLVITPLQYVNMSNCNLSGDIISNMIRGFCSRGVNLELEELDISGNNLSNIDGSLLASLMLIAHTLWNLNMSNCSLSGTIMNDMITQYCSSLELMLKLKELDIDLKFVQLDISGNNLSSIDGSLLASLLVITPLRYLNMSTCNLSGTIMDNIMKECCSRGVNLELVELDINGNNLSNMDGLLLASLLVIAHKMSYMNMSNCSLSDAIMNDMIRECCSLKISLELIKLDISDNNLSRIDGSLLSSLSVIAPGMSNLNLSNCCLSGAIMINMIRECCSRGVRLKLKELRISDNNLSSIDGSLLSSLFLIAPEISILNMSNCCFSGVIINNMIRVCCSRGFRLKLKELHISYNYLSNIDGSLLTSLLVIAHKMSNINITNCSLSAAIMTDMIIECYSLGISLELA